jgi:hypothetical protein
MTKTQNKIHWSEPIEWFIGDNPSLAKLTAKH